MPRAVRRLVLDYQLLWIGLDLILFALLCLMDWGWLFSVRSTSIIQWFVPVFSVFCGMFFTPKLPAWQPLPVSASARRRAQWWLWIGLPLIRAALAMAVPLAGLSALKGVHATPLQIASVLELQLIAVVPMGALFAGNCLLRRRFGLVANGLLVVPVFLLGMVFSAFALTGPAELAAGAVAIVALAAGSYAFTDRIAVAAAAWLSDPGEARPSWDWRRRPRGWAALGPYALSALLLAVAATVAIDYSMARMAGVNFAANAKRVLPSQMIMTVILISAIGGQAAPYALRALRALPLGPIALTAVLQGFMLAMVLAPVAVLWALMRATAMETSLIPVYLVGIIPVAALRLPVNFRVGVQAGMFLAIAPLFFLLFLPFAPWARSLWFDTAAILAAALVWVWTWWELACGRAAYRVQPLGVARWRGGLN